ANREVRQVWHLLVEPLVECSIAVVDVQVVALEEIVGNVDARPAIPVYIAHHHAQSKRDLASVDAGLRAYVGEVAVAIVVKQLVAAEGIADVPDVAQAKTVHWTERVVDEEHVQVPIVVVIEERR